MSPSKPPYRPRRSEPKTKPKVKNFVTPEKTAEHAAMLANRVVKRYAHLKKRFKKANIDCFRLYDWDIPEVRAVVDWYAGHLVVAEYVRLQTGPSWLPAVAKAVGEAMGLAPQNVHIKERRTKTEKGPRYTQLARKGKRFKVNERDLQFWVNLDDFLDTGLYSDHRDTRVIIKDIAKGKDFLNLFAYTGAVTCAAASGGAKTTTTVDRSETNLKWAKDNLKLNGLAGPRHRIVRSDTGRFLAKAAKQGKKYTLAFVDPPSFFQDQGSRVSFDISRDHPKLLTDVFKVMVPGSEVFFSTNHQRFEPNLGGLTVKELKEITPGTIPEDYRNRAVHRCWRMRV